MLAAAPVPTLVPAAENPAAKSPLRLSDNSAADVTGSTPLPPRRPAEAKPEPLASVPAAENVPTPPARPFDRLALENPSVANLAPLPPARPAELKPEAAPAAENVPPAAPVVQLGQNQNMLENAPVPPRRPDELAATVNPPPPVRLSEREIAPRRGRGRQARTVVASAPPADNRGFFERLFGAPQTSSPALGYAPSDGGVTTAARSVASGSSLMGRYDQYTAIYDISAHTVYLPNGTRLEAHSGLGEQLDNPRSVHIKMRGATPPTVYALTPREALFHGVQALRLTPLGGNVYGRAGLLAHTYMLGPNGDSNGCVSFRNYQAFLQAYQNGEIRRLAVVASLN
ncbi:MAG: tlde1 domain-containing protein [Methylocystis sp.]